jgi:hypothetical protein
VRAVRPVLLAIGLAAASAVAAPGVRVLGTPQHDSIRDAAAAPDGSLVLTGHRSDEASLEERWVGRLDPGGAPAWQLTHPVQQPELRIAAAPDGDALAATVSSIVAGDAGQVVVTRIAPGGTTRFTSAIATATSPTVDAIGVATDGSAWVAAWDDEGPRVLKLDAAGRPAWSLRGMGGLGEEALWSPLPGGAMLLAVSGSGMAWLTRLEADGVIAWARWAPRQNMAWTSLGVAPSGRITACASDPRAPGPWIGDISPDGALLASWHAVGETLSAAVAPDGSVLLTGPHEIPRGRWLPAAGRVSADRASVTLSLLHEPDGPWRPLLRATADGRALLAGSDPFAQFAVGFGGQDAWIAELDAADRLPCSAAEPLSIELRPNVADMAAATFTVAFDVVVEEPPQLLLSPGAASAIEACSAGGCAADMTEESSCADARHDLARAVARLNFCDDAEDRLDLSACAGALHVVTTSELGALADTVVEIWSPGCATLLASDDDGGGGRASQVAFTPAQDGTHHVVVRQKDGSAGADRGYVLSLARPACPSIAWMTQPESTDGWFRPMTAALLADGVLLAGVHAELEQPALMRVDAAGAPQWGLLEPNGLEGGWTSIAPRPDGSALLSGRAGESALVGEVDASGAPGPRTRLDLAGARLWALGAVDVGSGVLAWGEARAVPPRGWVARLDGGSVTWKAVIDREVSAMSAVPLPDGGALVALQPGGDPLLQRPWIARLGADGSVAWQRELDHPSAFVRFGGAAPFGGGILVACALLATPDAPTGTLALTAIDPAGNVVSERQESPWRGVDAVAACPDGGFLVHGASEISGPGGFEPVQRKVFERVEADGDVRWAIDAGFAQLTPRIGCGDDGAVALNLFSALERLDKAGRIPASCVVREAFVATPVAGPPTTLRPAAVSVVQDPGLVAVPLPSSWAPMAVLNPEWCSTEPCEALGDVVIRTWPDPPCAGAEVSLSAEWTGGRGSVSLEWDLDASMPGFDVDAVGYPTLSLAGAGTRTIAVRLRDACPWGADEIVASRAIDVAPAPQLAITGPDIHCAGEPCVTLTASPGFVSYEWSTGDVTPETCASPFLWGRYDVVAVDAAGCVHHASKIVEASGRRGLGAEITETCEGGLHRLAAEAGGGRAPIRFEWSTGASGAEALVPTGTHDVVLIDALGCTERVFFTTQLDCDLPGEATELRVLSSPDRLRFRRAGLGELDNVLAGRLGDFASPDAALGACHLAGTPIGGGRMQVDHALPAGTWVLVTSSNANGEGPAGPGSGGIERSSRPGWAGCGASP